MVKQRSVAPQELTWWNRIPLWLVLIVPSVTVIIVIAIINNMLSFQNSERVINTLTEDLLTEIDARITQHMDDYLGIPANINATNAHLIRNGLLDIDDQQAVEQHLWHMINIYDYVTSIYIGNPDGGLVSAGRDIEDDELYLMKTQDFARGELNKYYTDADGHYDEPSKTVSFFDANIRPWYVEAVNERQQHWIAPYVLSTGQDLAIANSQPVYDEDGNLLAVVSIDVFLSELNHFLQNTEISENSATYLVDHQGLLIANSVDAPNLVQNGNDTWERLVATQSEVAAIATSAQLLTDENVLANNIDKRQIFSTTVDGEAHFILVDAYHNNGLDWFIVIVIPSNEFLAPIRAYNWITVGLITVASLVAIVLGIITSLGVARSIRRLSNAAMTLARGDWSQPIPVSGVREVRQLGQAFDMMAQRLNKLIMNLEDEITKRTTELAKSEERYRAIVENQTELVCRFDTDFALTFVNAAYRRAFMASDDTEIGNATFLQGNMSDSQRDDIAALRRVFQSDAMLTLEYELSSADGSQQWVQWVISPLFDDGGNFVEYQAVGRDFSAQKELETTLQKALRHETQLNALKTDFVNTVSHEFRTPMTVILNSSQILQRYQDKLSVERQAQHFSKIEKQIDLMTNLLDGVLTISRAEQGRLPFDPAPYDFETLAQSVIDDVRTLRGADLTFEFVYHGNHQSIIGDSNLTRLILKNLVSNAAKYSHRGGVIKIHATVRDTLLTFSVHDEGIGIAPDAQAHIFKAFYRAADVETISGTGLGLAIVKQAVEQHNGIISFESYPDAGTTFTVQLPLKPIDTDNLDDNTHEHPLPKP